MPSSVNAFDLLGDEKSSLAGLDAMPLVVVTTAEPFLAREVMRLLRDRFCPDEEDRSWAWREFDGDSVEDPRDVFDEVATAPLLGGATRSAVVRNADAFVTRCRDRLEALADAPRSGTRGVVVLEVRSLPSNTRLAKAVGRNGLLVETAAPGRLDLPRWIMHWCRKRHGRALEKPAAQLLLERLAGDLGQVDRAIATLAVGGSGPITADLAATCEGVRGEGGSAWEMVETAAVGDAAGAIERLAGLLEAGESPVGLLAQAATVLRRLGSAAWLLRLPPGDGRPESVAHALTEVGVPAWPKALDRATAALRNLGPERARRLAVVLLEVDRALKAEASRGVRARLAIERLFCMLARRTDPVDSRPIPRKPRAARHG
jgi:DNA polymerase III delta subunit